MSAAADTSRAGLDAGADARGAVLLGAKRSALGVFAIRVGGAALAYGTQVLMARLMGKADYGIFATAWVAIVLVGHVSVWGIAQTACRFLPRYRVHDELDLARGFLRWGAMFTLSAALVSAFIGAAALYLARDAVGEARLWPFALGLLVLPLFALQDYAEGVSRAFNWTGLAIAPIYILRQGLIAVAMIAAYLIGRPADPTTAVACTLIATALALSVQATILRRRLKAVLPRGPRATQPGEWVRTTLPIALVDLALTGLNFVDVLLLGFFVPPADVGIYFAATRIVQLAMFVQFAASAATAPRFTEYFARGDLRTLTALVTRTARLATGAMIVVGAGVVATSPWLLALFGPGFSASVPIVAIWMTGIVVQSAFGPAEDLLNMLGAERLCAAVALGAFALAVALILLLVPRYGVTGAAVAMAVGIVVRNGAQCLAAKLRLGIATHIFARGTA